MTFRNLYAAILSAAMLLTVPTTARAETRAGDDGQDDKTDTVKDPLLARGGVEDPAGDRASHPVA